jgi:hypothetical protein
VGDKKVKRFHFSEIIGRLPYMRATVTRLNKEDTGLGSAAERGTRMMMRNSQIVLLLSLAIH